MLATNQQTYKPSLLQHGHQKLSQLMQLLKKKLQIESQENNK
jgi:hypothetical protein